jgi:DNA-binding NarL/FixJ family response regulator
MNAERARQSVFIVDDHPLVREWLTNLINQQTDLTVCGEAENAPQALRAISEVKPAVAIIDLSLKDSSGLELIKDLKQLEPAVKVLALSMHDESLYAERALRAGAKGYIMKRETTGRVIEAIRQVIEGKVYVSEAVTQAMTVKFAGGHALDELSPVELLSDRELEVFVMLGRGLGTRQIAEALKISLKTVQAYCARAKEKLHLKNATELLREAICWNETKGSK